MGSTGGGADKKSESDTLKESSSEPSLTPAAGDRDEEVLDPLRLWSATPARVTSEAWSPCAQA
eukprot:6415581-Pyramimonas_sp.AAC.1